MITNKSKRKQTTLLQTMKNEYLFKNEANIQ